MGGFADALSRTFWFNGDRDAPALFGVPSMSGYADALPRTSWLSGDRDALTLLGVPSMGAYTDLGCLLLLGKDEAQSQQKKFFHEYVYKLEKDSSIYIL
jgi:ribosome modulation factor